MAGALFYVIAGPNNMLLQSLTPQISLFLWIGETTKVSSHFVLGLLNIKKNCHQNVLFNLCKYYT